MEEIKKSYASFMGVIQTQGFELLQSAQKRVNDLSDQVTKLTARCEKAEQQKAKLQVQHDEDETQIAQLRAELDQLRKENQQMIGQNSQLSISLQTMQMQSQSMNTMAGMLAQAMHCGLMLFQRQCVYDELVQMTPEERNRMVTKYMQWTPQTMVDQRMDLVQMNALPEPQKVGGTTINFLGDNHGLVGENITDNNINK